MQAGGADGVPFSDPITDGPVIQETYAVVLQNRVDYATILRQVGEARSKGLTVPVLLMVITTLDLHTGRTKSYKMLAKPVPTREALGFLPPEMRERWVSTWR
ncbi:hypothetical protein PISMIDRAFT_618667 [Pisolithus microcarpus 441]|uniref:tryptophan synthase n=1 Tax=Pisolithus microcarpus 441 TaxID=765257 RepID=A0A0C9YSR2_9AGAM|nr:hypothetical protein PISMIDRAFT_618667 [Pisolithus microcarpus 441]